MSSDDRRGTNSPPTATNGIETPRIVKGAVHERDRNRCINCGTTLESAETLDVDHIVPRGVGGSEAYRNLGTLCRQCHDAKHGEGLAPTVELQSTGKMDGIEFDYFVHLMQEMLPAAALVVDVRLQPKFNLDDRDVWHLPVGDCRRLDKALSKKVDQYRSLQAADYM